MDVAPEAGTFFGDDECTRHRHPLFGGLSAQDGSGGMYTHLDAHLKQFGA
jgi:hypothetical protein